jgi:hypothetical protein
MPGIKVSVLKSRIGAGKKSILGKGWRVENQTPRVDGGAQQLKKPDETQTGLTPRKGVVTAMSEPQREGERGATIPFPTLTNLSEDDEIYLG